MTGSRCFASEGRKSVRPTNHLASVVFRVAAATGALLLAACGSSGGRGSFDGGVYRNGPVAFQIGQPPAAWRRVDVTSGSLAFRDDANDATILVNARCTKPDDATPLVALTNHLLIGSTEREVVSQTVEPFDHREALHSKVRAKWDGVPMSLDLYVLKKDGCTYDFVYSGTPASFEAGAPAFEQFVGGFRTLPGSGVVGG